ncbi:MAG TPA: ATP-dependent RNA helicase, partial [Gammaproteobacteria bacterium]|nr:ATP-dependent RNA helicase [Gammaproteobacteria bacterium]
VELSEKLEARGYASAAINGDMAQNARERTIAQLKNGKLDVLVATDVAARGLDVGRISHVLNYDIPYDTEAYIHRIGRTGRAGKQGDAILFVAPREKRLLFAIERATRKKIERMELPSTEIINDQRIAKFKQRITDTLATDDLGIFSQMVEQYQQEHNVTGLEIAAALAQLMQGETPFLIQHKPQQKTRKDDWDKEDRKPRKGRERAERPERRERSERPAGRPSKPEEGMERFRIEVGHDDNVKPGNIVGAIANEADIDAQYIGRINIFDDHSLVDLPEGMPKEVFSTLKKVWVSGQQLRISRLGKGKYTGDAGDRPRNKGKAKKSVGSKTRKSSKKKPGKS